MDDTKVIASLDTFYSACMDLRKHNYDKCIESCTIILSKNPYDQVGSNYFYKFTTATRNYNNFLVCDGNIVAVHQTFILVIMTD